MNVYSAIMKAADSIEQRPELFRFSSLIAPEPECGTPGCALGWIAYHSGLALPQRQGIVTGLGGKTSGRYWHDSEIYDWLGMDSDPSFFALREFDNRWELSATACARALRLYAEKYHSPVKYTGIPADVREIFEREVA